MPADEPRAPEHDFSGIRDSNGGGDGRPYSDDEFELRARARRAARGSRKPAAPGGPRKLDGLRRLSLVAVGLAALSFGWALFQPFAGSGGERVRVTIAKNSSVGEIAETLAEAGVIASSDLFTIRVRLAGKQGDLRAGNFLMRKDESYGSAIDTLSKAPVSAPVVDITIPEGLDRKRVAELAGDAGINGDYMKASADTSQFPMRRFGARGAKNLEGFLFPATYELKRGATAERLVRKQLQGFALNFGSVNMSYAKRKNLSAYDVVTIASMIEGEASLNKERPLVAAVIYNRLKQGIPLGIDATTRFETSNYTDPITRSTLEADTPYNTRINSGLPPGPIGNPGLASLKAAARPAKVNYLYYVAKPGACGEHAFSSSGAQFDADVAAYNEAREAAGGKDPQKC